MLTMLRFGSAASFFTFLLRVQALNVAADVVDGDAVILVDLDDLVAGEFERFELRLFLFDARP